MRLNFLNALPLAFLATLGLAVPLAAQEAQAPATSQSQARVNGWGLALTDVPPDPAVRYGRLANGMAYAIRKNSFPRDGAALRLTFDFGSLAEAENERGLAHFIEHMAFNGTTNVPEGEMVKTLQRLGLRFGPDTNAFTGFDRTTYQLDLPKAGTEEIDTALFLMREVASEVKFDAAAVEKERGVILGERRARDNFQYRGLLDRISFFLPEGRLAERIPIGTVDVLQNAPAERLADLYRRYYRPENAVLIFVGDANPDAIEAKIRERFGNWQGVGEPGKPMDHGSVDLKRPRATDTFVDPAETTTVRISRYRPWEEFDDTIANRRRFIVEDIAQRMFNRRLQRLVQKRGSGLISAGLGASPLEKLAYESTLNVSARDGEWARAIAAAELEARRALTHGFRKSELDLVIADRAGAYKRLAAQAGNRTHAQLAQSILNTVESDGFVTTPQFRSWLFEQVAPTITTAEIDKAFRRIWSGSDPLIHLSLREKIDERLVGAAWARSGRMKVAPPEDESDAAFAYDEFGEPGEIVADGRIEDLGIRTIRFANNVRLNIKTTKFERGEVGFSIRVDGGAALLPQDRQGLALFMTSTSALGGTGAHSLEEMQRLMAGKNVRLGYAVGNRSVGTGGNVASDELEAQLKVAAAFLSDPGYRTEASERWNNLVPLIDEQVAANPGSVAGTRLPYILTGDDSRFGVPPSSVLQQRSLDEAKEFLPLLLSDAPIEIGIVGDVDEQEAIDAVAATFGALSPRADRAPARPRPAALRSSREPIALTHKGPADQAMVVSIWPTTDDTDFEQEVAMSLLAQVLDLALTDKIREELGATYGVDVSSVMSDDFVGLGWFTIAAIIDPTRIDEVRSAILESVAEFARGPIDSDLIERARKPIVEQVDLSQRRNSYWLGYVAQAQGEPERLERHRKQSDAIRAVTAEQLQELARRYLVPSQRYDATITSDKASKTS